MTHINIRELQKISGEAISALPGPARSGLPHRAGAIPRGLTPRCLCRESRRHFQHEARRAMRQAVVIIHGIGEQRPMETVRAFVAGALGVEKEALSKFVFSKPDQIDDTLELRRLSASTKDVEGSVLEKNCETDFYELYWQHLMPDGSWSAVLAWVFDLTRRKLP